MAARALWLIQSHSQIETMAIPGWCGLYKIIYIYTYMYMYSGTSDKGHLRIKDTIESTKKSLSYSASTFLTSKSRTPLNKGHLLWSLQVTVSFIRRFHCTCEDAAVLVEEEVEEVVESRVSLPMEAGRTTSMPRYSLPVTMARCSSHWMSYSSLVALVM